MQLPRSFAGIFTMAAKSNRRSTRFEEVLRGGLAALWVGSSGCEGEYTAEPTFCDDWCAALRHPDDCAEAPASCVRDCELTKASAECFPHQEQLLACYQDLKPNAFSCAPFGLQASSGDRQRVNKDACRAERDELFECEAPGFAECLGTCRGYQAILTQGAIGEGIGLAVPDDCPLLTQPCETICWSAFLFTSDELDRLRLPTTADGRGQMTGESSEAAADAGTDAGAPSDSVSDDPIAKLFSPCVQTSGAAEPNQ
jgi:hypothetical protein